MGILSLFETLLGIIVLPAICYGQECDPNGISCINCTDYQECSAGAPKGPIFSCRNGIKPLLEHCWSKLNCYALNECTEVGIFPDAMIESNYFVCLTDSGSGFVKYDFTCPEGEFFDKTARMCVASDVTSASTLQPTTETTTAVTSTSPTSDTTITTQTPAITTSVTTPLPTPENTTTTQAPATTTSVTTPLPTPENTTITQTSVTTPVSTNSPSFACTAPGIFPNPTNCKMYFRCSTSLKVFYYICPGTSYFNENLLKCSLIITPACQQQILQNSTTSATPITTSTATTTPVPTLPPTTTTPVPLPPLTTTTTFPTPTITTTTSTQPATAVTTLAPTTTTTTTQASSTPFSCSAAGTFENPVDCKTYYRCSSSGKIFLYVCPNGSFYNEFTKLCGLTITPRCRSKL